ncbi:MAG: type II toxin-antitoxin system VapC family toxin [Anaerolineales bacterium]
MAEALSTFTSSSLYLDTMILYVFLRKQDEKTEALFRRISEGTLMAYTSVLTFDELAYKMLLALISDTYPGSPLDHLRDRETALIAEFYPRLAPALTELRAFPHLTLLSCNADDLVRMDKTMLRYQLRPRDALHVSAMQKCNCFDLLSHDADFDRVPDVHRYTLF